jgi:hypothetical protein
MNRNPKTGDLIYIGKKKVEYLVLEGGRAVEGDNYAGCSYDWFTAVRATVSNPITGAIDGSKGKKYYTMVAGASYPVTPLAEIQLVGTAKFKTVTTVEHFITKIKDV